MNRILPGLIWLILWILSWLPGFLLQFLAWVVNLLVYRIFRYRYQVVHTNLENSFPELPLTELEKIATRFYRHFSELFLEIILMLRLNPKRDSKHIRFANPELIHGAYRQNRNIILMTGHYGNWEWNVLPVLQSGYRILGVYKPQTSRFADELMKRIRHKRGILLVSMKETMRIISREVEHDSSPFALILVADQIPARGDIHFWTKFLNQESAFFTGGEKLAKRFGLAVFYIDQQKLGFGRYEARLTAVYDGEARTDEGTETARFAALLENSIRKDPAHWLWSHRRWKYRREELPLHV